MTNSHHTPAQAALIMLIILQFIMLSALYAGVAPHPPAQTPLFGMAPFLGAALGVAGGALAMGATSTAMGRVLCGLAAVMAAISFGPQKYFDPQFPLIWPAVITAQGAIITLVVQISRRGWFRQNSV